MIENIHFFKILGQAIDIPSIRGDEFNSCSLLIDHSFKVNIHYQNTEGCLVHALLLTLTEEQKIFFFPKLLEANLFWFWSEHENCTFGLEPVSGSIFLTQKIIEDHITVERLKKAFKSFLKILNYWKNEIENHLNPNPKLSIESS